MPNMHYAMDHMSTYKISRSGMRQPSKLTKLTPEQIKLRMELQGQYLKPLREAQGLTQLDVATHIGFQQDTMVAHYESGRNWVGADRYQALAEVLQVNPTELTTMLVTFRTPALSYVMQTTLQVLENNPELKAKVQKTMRLIARMEADMLKNKLN